MMSDEERLADLVCRARELPPPTEEERNEARASFAYGTLALMRQYRDASPEVLEALRQMCRKAAGCLGLVLTLLVSCAPCPCDHPPVIDAGSAVRVPVIIPPLEPDPLPMCGRTSTLIVDGGVRVVPLPCRPYDRMIDLADPQP